MEKCIPGYSHTNTIPVNSTAAKVVFCKGFYEEYINNDTGNILSDLPLKTREIPWDTPNLTGYKVGKLTVIGLHYKKYEGKNKRPKWVCKCACGNYVLRKTKAVKNGKNDSDSCQECDSLTQIKRNDNYRTTGKWE
jgi:hypothetical protein